MPDLKDQIYDRGTAFNDTGSVNVNVPGPYTVDAPAIPERAGANTAPPSPFDALDSISSSLGALTSESNPFIKSIQFTAPYKTPLQLTERYKDPIYGFDPFNPNLENQYGDRQGILEKWKNNLIKFGANVGGTFIESIATIPLAINAISQGDLSKMYDNKVSNGINDWMTNLETALPNYETTFESKHPVLNYIPFIGNSGDSWGGLLKNLGFTVGAIAGSLVTDLAVGAVTGGVGEAPLIAPQMMRAFGSLGKIFTAEKGATTFAEEALRSKELLSALESTASKIKILDRFRYGLTLGTAAISEGTFEANNLFHSVGNELNEAFYKQYNRDPNAEEKAQFAEWSKTAGNVNLIANTALLTLTDSLEFGSLFKPAKVLNKQLEAEVAKGASIALKQGSIDVFEQTAAQQLKKRGFSLVNDNIVRPAVSGIRTNLIEGFEEGSQFFFQRTGEEYYKRKFDDKSTTDTDNFMHSMGTALNDTFTTKEGLENVLLGFMSGAVVNGVRNLVNNRRGVNSHRDQMVNAALGLLNSQRVSGLFDNTYHETVTANSIYNSMHDALLGNDMHNYKNFKFQQLFNFVKSGVDANRYDLRIGQLNLMKELPQSEFEKMFNLDYTNDNRRTVGDQVDNLISKAQTIKQNIDKVEDVFGKNPYDRKTQFLDHESFETYKEQLALNLSEMQDNRARLNQLRDELGKLAPLVGHERLLQIVSKKGSEQIATEFDNRVKDIDQSLKLAAEDNDTSPRVEELKQEKAFLQDKASTLRSNMETFDTDIYLNEVQDILKYYANGNSLSKNETISPIDTLEIVNKAYDSYRLVNNTDAALYHYQQLVSKKGFDQYIAEVKTELNNQQQRWGAKLSEQLGETGNPAATETTDTDIQDLDENGNPISPKPEAPVVPTPQTVEEKAKVQGVELSTNDTSTEVTLPFEETKANNLAILPIDLKGAKPRYSYGDKQYQLAFENDIDKAAYIAAQATKSKRDADYVKFVMDNTGMSEDQVRAYGQQIRNNIKELAKQGNGGELTIPSQQKVEGSIPAQNVEPADPATPVAPIAVAETKVPEEDRLTPDQASVKAPNREGKFLNRVFATMNPFVFFNKVFSNAKGSNTQQNLRKVIFSMSPEEIAKGLNLKVKESTQGQKATDVRQFPELRGLFYRGYAHDIEMYVGKTLVGIMQPHSRLLFKRGSEYMTLDQMTQEEYDRLSGNKPETYSEFISTVNDYASLYKGVMDKYAGGKQTFTTRDVTSLMDVIVNYGNIFYSSSSSSATKIKDLSFHSKGSAVISLPMVWNAGSGRYERTSEVKILNESELDENDKADTWKYIADNIDAIKSLDSRYVYLMKMPDGTFKNTSRIAARPAEVNQESLENLYKTIQGVGEKISPERVKALNAQLKEGLYIADSRNAKGSRTQMSLMVDENGEVYLRIFNDKGITNKEGVPQVYNKRIRIPEAKTARNFEDFVNLINRKLIEGRRNDSALDKLNLVLNTSDFKNGVIDDEDVTMDQLSDKLTVAVSPGVFNNFSISVLPKSAEEKVKPKKAPKEAKAPKPAPVETVAETPAPTQTEAAPAVVEQSDKDKIVEAIKANRDEIAKKGILGEAIARHIDDDPEGVFTMLADQSVAASGLANLVGQDIADKLVAMDAGRYSGQTNLQAIAEATAEERVQETMPSAEDDIQEEEEGTPEYVEEVHENSETPNVEIGGRVLYQGKEYTVADKVTTASGRVIFTINDGTRYGDKIIDGRDTHFLADSPQTQFDVNSPEDVTDTLPEAKRYRDLEKEWVDESLENEKTNYDLAGLKTILERLNQKFNLPYRVVKTTENWRGRFKNGVVEINVDKFDKTTPFHEYLHPFIEILKNDNDELYRNLVLEFAGLDIAPSIIGEVRMDEAYKGATAEEIGDEALVRYISDRAAKNVNEEGRRYKAPYLAKMKTLIDKFRSWFNKLWDRAGLRKINPADIPLNANLEDIADLVSLHDVQFDFSNNMAIVNAMEKYQAVSPKVDKDSNYKDALVRKVRVLEDTAKRRVPSQDLIDQVIVARGALKEADVAASLTNYGIQAVNGVAFANDMFKRISGELEAANGNLRPQDINRLNKQLEVTKAMLAFWLNDAKYLFTRTVEGVDPQSYKRLDLVLKRADATVAQIHGKSIELATEWLYPYIEQVNERIKTKNPDLVITKEKFATSMRYANSDIDSAFFLLGSVGSSRDAFSAVVSSAIKDVFEENHVFEHELSTKIKLEYDKFLQRTGLKNENKQTEQHYKDNYLRKATVLEQKRDKEGLPEKDAAGNPVYEYVDRWAFHEEFFHDLFERDKANYIDSLGEQLDIAVDPKAYQEWVDKVFTWHNNNSQNINGEIVPGENYRNPKFAELQNDPHFKLLYNTYKEGNEKLFSDERLKYGVIPQVRTKDSFLAGVTSSEAGVNSVGDKAKTLLGKVWDKILPRANESEFSDTQEELDGSLYKQIPVPFVNMADEKNLSFSLPETVLAFGGSSNLVNMKREMDSNLRTVKTIINGNNKFGIEARKITKVTSKRATIFDHILKLPAKKEAQNERLNKQLNAFIDDVMYGDTELQTVVNIFGRPVDMNKLGANMAFLTALNNMAFNVTAGISNSTIGNFQTLGEALGSKYYGVKDWGKAQADYFKAMPDYLKDATSLRKSLITQLGIKYDAIQGEFRDKYGKKFVGSAMQRYGTLDSIFFLSHGAEHQIQLTGMLALMNATKVKTKDSGETNLYDAHYINPEGYLRLKDNAIWTTSDEREFTRRLHSLNKLLNGNYSKFDKAHLQRTWWGKLLLIYRKYLYNGFRNRYGKQRVDYELGDVHEGYYRAFFSKLTTDIKDYKLEAAKRFFTKEGWNDDEKYAYGKTVFELGSFIGLATILVAIGLASKSGGAGDDKEGKWLQNYTKLWAVRLRADIGTFSTFGLSDMVKIMQNPSAVMNTLANYAKFTSQMFTKPFATYTRKTGQFKAGDSLLKAKFLKALPLSRQIINFMNPKDQLQYYQLLGKY